MKTKQVGLQASMLKPSSDILEQMLSVSKVDERYGRSVSRVVDEIVRIGKNESTWCDVTVVQKNDELIAFGVMVCDQRRINKWKVFLKEEGLVVDQNLKVAELLYVYVDSSNRRKGLGSGIVRSSLDKARKAGYQRVWALVSDMDAGVSLFYDKNGGRMVGDFSDEEEGHTAMVVEWGLEDQVTGYRF